MSALFSNRMMFCITYKTRFATKRHKADRIPWRRSILVECHVSAWENVWVVGEGYIYIYIYHAMGSDGILSQGYIYIYHRDTSNRHEHDRQVAIVSGCAAQIPRGLPPSTQPFTHHAFHSMKTTHAHHEENENDDGEDVKDEDEDDDDEDSNSSVGSSVTTELASYRDACDESVCVCVWVRVWGVCINLQTQIA